MLVVVLLMVGAGLATSAPVRSTPQTYLIGALNLLRLHSMDRDRVDWPRAEAEAVRRAADVTAPAGTYSMIREVIAELGNPHTRLVGPASARAPLPESIDVPRSHASHGVAVVRVPGFVADPAGERRYVAAGVAALQAVEGQATCGWVVDLRDNIGGNMWPMLTVLAPLLGDGVVGSFSGPGVAPVTWSVRDGRAVRGGSAPAAETNPVRLTRPRPPIAVLTSKLTSSSGEATLVAFRGMPGVETFGAPTGGAATGNEVFDLSDGAQLLITTVVDVDRTGRIYGNVPIEPDHSVPPADAEAVAAQWVRAQGGCG
ncbi:S41 family peptidase [Amycolatopsis carbonis]|uniref:S41 family peptidase n=1 Tax=Amycolatopsis carbonis TaxID=715471 RepID=A0A9Y2IDV1_9PSEU|nr:S41 family peptidase [Amycolatopsis sp. 2-15]WIX76698.1 S41 family peptidase [Amycolatopsis sp. 2-15]